MRATVNQRNKEKLKEIQKMPAVLLFIRKPRRLNDAKLMRNNDIILLLWSKKKTKFITSSFFINYVVSHRPRIHFGIWHSVPSLKVIDELFTQTNIKYIETWLSACFVVFPDVTGNCYWIYKSRCLLGFLFFVFAVQLLPIWRTSTT